MGQAIQHQTELTFFENILRNYNIPFQIITSSREIGEYKPDFGLRELITSDAGYNRPFQVMLEKCAPNKIYRVKDSFLCQYYFFQMSDETLTYVLIGPFTTKEITHKDILDIIEHFSLPLDQIHELQRIYYNIPVISRESGLLVLVNTFCQQIWGGIENFSLLDIYDSTFFNPEPVAARPNSDTPEDAFLNMKNLEKKYESENRLLSAIAHGQTHKAEMLMGAFSNAYVEMRSVNSLRNLKNYAIIANTLMRKAAEFGNVHPLHIDSLSSRFAKAIEEAHSAEAIYKLGCEMARKYCLLVNNHSMRGVTPLIQKVLVRIDSDITADLSLKTHAKLLNVNASYLSTLFKCETGSTLTDYVNRKRVDHGIFLLNTTNLPIQTIAQQCGIQDVNYFTKTFKKYINQTPTEYRRQISSFS